MEGRNMHILPLAHPVWAGCAEAQSCVLGHILGTHALEVVCRALWCFLLLNRWFWTTHPSFPLDTYMDVQARVLAGPWGWGKLRCWASWMEYLHGLLQWW